MEDTQESPEELLQDNLHRETYNPNTKTLNFRNTRATDIKNNPRVYQAKDRPVREELELGARRAMIGERTRRFLSESRLENNLTESERKGIRKECSK